MIRTMYGDVNLSNRIQDASRRLEMARQCLEEADFAGAIREAQACVELSLKALLDILQIKYEKKHDVGTKIPEAFRKMKPFLLKEPYYTKFETWKKRIGIAVVLSRILAAVRNETTYGIQELGLSSQEVFLYFFGEKLSKVLVHYAEEAFIDFRDLVKLVEHLESDCSIP